LLEPADASAHLDAAGDLHEVGRIVGSWGVKGWIKVQPYAEDAGALLGSRRWTLAEPEDRVRGADTARSLTILNARRHGEFVLAQAEGIGDRDVADALRGRRVLLDRSAFPQPPTDAYYWVDLIGLPVVNRDGAALGTVVGLVETGAHAVLRVRPTEAEPETAERLIPFVNAYIDDVDLAGRSIRVDWDLDY